MPTVPIDHDVFGLIRAAAHPKTSVVAKFLA